MKIRGKAAQRYRNLNIKILNLGSPQQTSRQHKRKDTGGIWKEEGGPDDVLKANG